QLAYCCYFTEQYDSSISYNLRAISLDDENYTYYTNLALSYQKLDSADRLIGVYKKMIELHHPDEIASLYFQIAMEYSPQKQTTEAVEAYRRALAIRPYYPSALFALGECYEIAGNTSAARKAYEEFIQLTASDSTENMRRSTLKHRLRKLSQ
ncbi:MAG TPA: tetratricopeptide repeat protein, partial [Nitrospirota bacterium]|nr:tetratricopeptide repeat protein [Nitrospirota bacterium]